MRLRGWFLRLWLAFAPIVGIPIPAREHEAAEVRTREIPSVQEEVKAEVQQQRHGHRKKVSAVMALQRRRAA